MTDQQEIPNRKSSFIRRIRESIQRDDLPLEDDRGRMKMVMNSLILHIHPSRVPKPALKFSYTFGLGGLLLLLAAVLAVTGVLLIFVYTPSPDAAYDSMLALQTEVYFGNLIRNLHHWSGNLMVVVGVLHLLRVFYTAGFTPRFIFDGNVASFYPEVSFRLDLYFFVRQHVSNHLFAILTIGKVDVELLTVFNLRFHPYPPLQFLRGLRVYHQLSFQSIV